jgi:hypothetical protein
MMRFGRMPLFPMQTSEQLREEGRRINLERLISDIAADKPLQPFEHRPWMRMNHIHQKNDATSINSRRGMANGRNGIRANGYGNS